MSHAPIAINSCLINELSGYILDVLSSQVSKFQTALADEKVVCDSAKQASLTALQLSKRKAQLQASLITAEKTIAKSQENFATLTDELKVQTEKVNVATEQVEDAKKELRCFFEVLFFFPGTLPLSRGFN